MLHSIPRFTIILLVVIGCLRSSAQEVAPYSRFGIGEIESPNFAASKGMGGIAAGYRSPLRINFINPASYTSLSFTTLELGMNFITKQIKDSISSYQTGDGFIDYLALAFPVSKSVGASFGLVPFSKMNYEFEESQNNPELGGFTNIFTGNGRAYQLYFGGAYKYPNNDTSVNLFSIGLNVAYLFGQFDQQQIKDFADTVAVLNSRKASHLSIGDISFNPGVQYSRRIKNNVNGSLHLVTGAYAFIPLNRNANYTEVWDRLSSVSGVSVDTILVISDDKKKLNVPAQYGLGVTITRINKTRNNRWLFGADVKYVPWSNFEKLNKGVIFTDLWRFALGAEYVPSYDPNKSFIKRSSYRLGGYFEKGYLQLIGNSIDQYGITFGMEIPIRSFSSLVFSFETGSRGTTKDNLTKENFFMGFIGFTLNDKWFIKRKYD